MAEIPEKLLISRVERSGAVTILVRSPVSFCGWRALPAHGTLPSAAVHPQGKVRGLQAEPLQAAGGWQLGVRRDFR